MKLTLIALLFAGSSAFAATVGNNYGVDGVVNLEGSWEVPGDSPGSARMTASNVELREIKKLADQECQKAGYAGSDIVNSTERPSSPEESENVAYEVFATAICQ